MDDQSINCRFYSCAYGCAKKQFCELLNKFSKEDFIRRNPNKTIVDDGDKWYVMDKGPNYEVLPTVDVTEIIDMYNTVVKLYNTCIDDIDDHFYNMTHDNEDFMKFIDLYVNLELNIEQKFREIYLDSNIVHPIKELLAMINMMGNNMRIMINFIETAHEMIQFYDLKDVEVVNKKIMDENNYLDMLGQIDNSIMVGGGKIDDLKMKVKEIHYQLKKLKKGDLTTTNIEKFIKHKKEKLIDQKNDTQILTPVRIDFDGVRIPKTVSTKVIRNFGQELNSKITVELEEEFNAGKAKEYTELLDDKIKKILSKQQQIMGEIELLNIKKTKINELSEITYSDDEFTFLSKSIIGVEDIENLKAVIKRASVSEVNLKQLKSIKKIYDGCKDNFLEVMRLFPLISHTRIPRDAPIYGDDELFTIGNIRKISEELDLRIQITEDSIINQSNNIYATVRSGISDFPALLNSAIKNKWIPTKQKKTKKVPVSGINTIDEFDRFSSKFGEIKGEYLDLKAGSRVDHKELIGIKKLWEKYDDVLKQLKILSEEIKRNRPYNDNLKLYLNNLVKVSGFIKIIFDYKRDLDMREIESYIAQEIDKITTEIVDYDRTINILSQNVAKKSTQLPDINIDKIQYVVQTQKEKLDELFTVHSGGVIEEIDLTKKENDSFTVNFKRINRIETFELAIYIKILALSNAVHLIKKINQDYLDIKLNIQFLNNCVIYYIDSILYVLDKYSRETPVKFFTYEQISEMMNNIKVSDENGKILHQRITKFSKKLFDVFTLNQENIVVIDQTNESFIDLLLLFYFSD